MRLETLEIFDHSDVKTKRQKVKKTKKRDRNTIKNKTKKRVSYSDVRAVSRCLNPARDHLNSTCPIYIRTF